MVAFLSGAVLTAANLNSAFNALTFRAVTGTSDTFLLADNGGAVSFSNASPITATVPPFSSVAYANGTVIQLLNLGAGVVTVTAGAGVTLNGASLTLAQNAGGTLIKTATNTWYFLPSSTGSGMDLITPTSVVGGTLSGGQITFTAATEVSVNGCFTSAYENYRVMLNVTAPTSGTTYITGRMRAAGTNAAGANYTFCYSGSSAGGFQGNYSTGQTSFSIKGDGSVETPMGVAFDITSPALAVATGIPSLATFGLLSGNNGMLHIMQRHTLATAYDGMSLLVASGTMSGTLRIYGLRNS
jgi:hypothetical protein